MIRRLILIFALLAGIAASSFGASASWPLTAEASVDSTGIFLKNIVAPAQRDSVPDVRIGDAPTFGRATILTRAQLNDLLSRAAPDVVPVWSGPERVRVVRKTRKIDETEMKALVTAELQREHVRDRGELELRMARPFVTATVPDEPLTMRVLDLPAGGVSPNFIVRCELRAGDEPAGSWQLGVTAKIWRDVYVARSACLRGQTLQSADLGLERRDVLTAKDSLTALPSEPNNYDIAENLSGGALLTARSIKQRPIVRRGKMLDAQVQSGPMTILVKVEALEDGLPGQTVRVRNIKSRREFRGKVKDEETIAVNM